MYVKNRSVKGARIGAAIIDIILVGIITTIVGTILSLSYGYLTVVNEDPDDINTALNTLRKPAVYSYIFSLLFVFLYYTVIPYFTKGKTLGKLMLGIKVVSIDYSIPTFGQLLLRNIFFFETLIFNGLSVLILYSINSLHSASAMIGSGAVGWFSYLINIVIMVMILATAEERGFHDMIARTYVVSKDFDLDKLNRVNAIERKDMEWAEFDDDNNGEIDIINNNDEDDEIGIIQQDEIELLNKDNVSKHKEKYSK